MIPIRSIQNHTEYQKSGLVLRLGWHKGIPDVSTLTCLQPCLLTCLSKHAGQPRPLAYLTRMRKSGSTIQCQWPKGESHTRPVICQVVILNFGFVISLFVPFVIHSYIFVCSGRVVPTINFNRNGPGKVSSTPTVTNTKFVFGSAGFY